MCFHCLSMAETAPYPCGSSGAEERGGGAQAAGAEERVGQVAAAGGRDRGGAGEKTRDLLMRHEIILQFLPVLEHSWGHRGPFQEPEASFVATHMAAPEIAIKMKGKHLGALIDRTHEPLKQG